MFWNLITFVLVTLALVADLILFAMVMRPNPRKSSRCELAADRVERACAAHARVVEGSLREVAERSPRRVREYGWGEPDARDADFDEGVIAYYERPDSSDAPDLGHGTTKGPEPSA